jgi:hypothetical protein
MSPRRSEVSEDPEELFISAIEEMPDEYVACREMGHPWRISSPFRLVDTDLEDRPPRGGYRQFAERKWTCARCGKVRSDAFAITTSRGGHTALHKIAPSKYDDPEGWKIAGIGGVRGLRDLLYGRAFDAQVQREERNRERRRRT